jgi:hypothetical protein
MGNKRKGIAFERQILKELTKHPEVYAADRVAGSLGPYDIVANIRGIPLYVQCKVRKHGSCSLFSRLFAEEIEHTEQIRNRAIADGYVVPAFAMIYGHQDGYFLMLFTDPRLSKWKGGQRALRFTTLQALCEKMIATLSAEYGGMVKVG